GPRMAYGGRRSATRCSAPRARGARRLCRTPPFTRRGGGHASCGLPGAACLRSGVSLSLLFAGQGTQHAAMLPWLEARPEAAATLMLIAAELGADWRAQLEAREWAFSNAVAQPLLTG